MGHIWKKKETTKNKNQSFNSRWLGDSEGDLFFNFFALFLWYGINFNMECCKRNVMAFENNYMHVRETKLNFEQL